MNTCATCKHWRHVPKSELGPADPWPDKVTGEDEPRWGWCNLIGLPGYGETTDLSAYTQDGSDYRADLHTRDDFGCTLHNSDEMPSNQDAG